MLLPVFWPTGKNKKKHNEAIILGGVVPVERLELPTFGLQNRCTTTVLHRRLRTVFYHWAGALGKQCFLKIRGDAFKFPIAKTCGFRSITPPHFFGQ